MFKPSTRPSRKRTRNRFVVQRGGSNNEDPLNISDAQNGMQPQTLTQAPQDESKNLSPGGSSSGCGGLGCVKTGVNYSGGDTSLCRSVDQSASSSPKRFRSNTPTSNRSVSPARFFREKEQSELQNLNDRLLGHVDTVKQLQTENANLRLQLDALEVLRAEGSNGNNFNQSDIETLQELLDKSRQENNSLEKTLQVVRKERESLRQALQKKDEDYSLLQIKVDNLKPVAEQCGKMENEIKTLMETLKEREADGKRLSADLVKEKVARNRVEDEAQINKSRYIKELEETRERLNKHMEEADQKLEAGYEALFSQSLASVREQNLRDVAALREELTTLYQTKLSKWKSMAERANADLISTKKELKASRTEMDSLRAQNVRLKMDAAAIKVQIDEDQSKFNALKNEHEREACQLQREAVILKQELSELKEELEEIGGANDRLEREIATYRILLDDLDTKNPFCKQVKKGRHEDQEEMSGSKRRDEWKDEDQNVYLITNSIKSEGVNIDTVGMDGRYLSVINRTDHLVDLCLWCVRQSSDDQMVKYEIPSSTPVMSDQRLYIWGDGEGPFKDKPGYDQILSLPDDQDTRDIYGIHIISNNNNTSGANSSNEKDLQVRDNDATITDGNSGDSEMTDAIHIAMRGKWWLRQVQSMNVRLEDGDGQLQAKCDLTSVRKRRGFHLDQTVTHSQGQDRRLIPSSLLRGSGHAHGKKEKCNSRRSQMLEKYARVKSCDESPAISKDDCILM